MKIKVQDADQTIRFTNENAGELFALGRLAERLKGYVSPMNGDAKEVVVDKSKLLEFLTK